MLTRYIREAMHRARFKTLDNGTYFGAIPGLAGVWADEATVEACRNMLQEVLEEWLILKIRDNDPIPASDESACRTRPLERWPSRFSRRELIRRFRSLSASQDRSPAVGINS